MPVPYLKKLHEKTGKPMLELEKLWDQCKKEATAADKDAKHYWGYVVFLLKKKLGLSESLSFREFVDIENEVLPQGDHVHIPPIIEPALEPEVHIEPAPVPALEVPAEQPEQELPPAPADALEASTPRNLVSKLFSARDKAHQLHLATKSFSQHMALGDFYEELLDLADEIAETTQGKYGIMHPIVSTPMPGDDAKAFITDLAAWAETAHGYVPAGDTFLGNLIDELQALIYRTKYKLDNLS